MRAFAREPLELGTFTRFLTVPCWQVTVGLTLWGNRGRGRLGTPTYIPAFGGWVCPWFGVPRFVVGGFLVVW